MLSGHYQQQWVGELLCSVIVSCINASFLSHMTSSKLSLLVQTSKVDFEHLLQKEKKKKITPTVNRPTHKQTPDEGYL